MKEITLQLEPQNLIEIGSVAVGLFVLLLGLTAMTVRSLRTAVQGIGKMSDTLITLNNELQENSKDRVKDQHDRERLSKAIAEVRVEAQSLRERIGAYELKNTQLQHQVDELRANLLAKDKRITDLERQIAEYQIERSALQEKLQLQGDTIATLESRLSTVDQERAKLQIQVDQLVSERTRMQREMDGLRLSLTDTEQARCLAEEKYMAAQGEMRDLKAQIERLEKRLDEDKPITGEITEVPPVVDIAAPANDAPVIGEGEPVS